MGVGGRVGCLKIVQPIGSRIESIDGVKPSFVLDLNEQPAGGAAKY